MTKHILCAVDLAHDGDARAILAESGRLADLYDARLSVITVLPDYGSSWVGTFFKEGTMKEAAQAASDALHKMAVEVLPEQQGVQHIVDIGSAYDKVLERIKRVGADMVVVGANRPDLKDHLLGPNAARIVRNAGVSVLVVRLS